MVGSSRSFDRLTRTPDSFLTQLQEPADSVPRLIGAELYSQSAYEQCGSDPSNVGQILEQCGSDPVLRCSDHANSCHRA